MDLNFSFFDATLGMDDAFEELENVKKKKKQSAKHPIPIFLI